MSLQLTEKETLYHRKNFYETMKVHGIKCKVYSIADKHEDAYDFYNDIQETESSYDDFIYTNITYEEHPQIKTLKSLGWYSDKDQVSPIAYIPVLYKDSSGTLAEFTPSIDDKIVIESNVFGPNPSTNEFLIKDFLSNGFPNTIYYTCKLVPYFQNNSTDYE